MQAGLRRRVALRPRHPRNPAPDAGFTLTEVLVALMIIGVVMASLTTFYISSMATVSYQRSKQTAIQLASSGVDRVRALKGSDLAATPPPSTPAPPCPPETTVDVDGVDPSTTMMKWDHDCPSLGLTYNRYWYIGTCWKSASDDSCTQTSPPATNPVEFVRVLVAVTWRDKNCQNSACTYATSTLVSAASDPLFDSTAKAPPPTVTPPPNQASYLGDVVPSIQALAPGGVPPVTFWATGLPDGVQMDSSGKIVPATGNTAGTINDSSGTIAGSPKKTYTFTVTATASDGFGNTGTASFNWTVATLPQLASPGVLNAPKGAPYTFDLNTLLTGGLGPYTWSLTGSLPTNLTLNTSTGVISGTPQKTTAQPQSVSVTMKDKNGKLAQVAFDVAVVPRITTNPTVPITTNVSKTASLQATADGTAPFTWSATNLPDGLTIDGKGLVTGTVNRGSRWVTTITVTDANGATGTLTFVWTTTVTKTSQGPALTGPGDRTDPVGQSVSVQVTAASGGSTPSTWAVTGLPPGTASSGGRLTGAPTQAGSYLVTVQATDSNGRTATYMFVWTIQ